MCTLVPWHVWRPGINVVESILSLHFSWVLGVKLSVAFMASLFTCWAVLGCPDRRFWDQDSPLGSTSIPSSCWSLEEAEYSHNGWEAPWLHLKIHWWHTPWEAASSVGRQMLAASRPFCSLSLGFGFKDRVIISSRPSQYLRETVAR